jgi:NADPH:quinone reductase-like Zn-dependent oxidoreductase
MRAVQYRSYGPVAGLHIEQAPTPRTSEGQVLVRVARAALNPKDSLLRVGQFRPLSGRNFPKFTGLDFAGEVLESRCSSYREGDRVFGFLNEWGGRRGTLADLVVASRSELSHLPDGVSAEQGAAVALVGSTCLQALRDIGQIGPGAQLLIHGASGGVGTVAIQIARLLGASVTTLSSESNIHLCRRLGAAEAWPYTRLTEQLDLSRYDCIFDVHGSLSGRDLRKRMKKGASFVSTVPTPTRLLRNLLTRTSSVQERVVMVRACEPDLQQLARWLEAGQLEAVVDQRFKLENVHQAFACLESRHARGKVIIDVD